MFEIAREPSLLSQRIVTTSPDVTASTNLTGWVNRKGVFHSSIRADVFQDEKVPSPQKWLMAPGGQHIELGIAEHNLFLLLGQLGLADKFWGERLLPIGTVYDPFINRGLDPLIYACYQGARFMLVATPSGITLGPEGGAHQSINTPLIGMAQDGLSYFEPAYADELAAMMSWGLRHIQADAAGSSDLPAAHDPRAGTAEAGDGRGPAPRHHRRRLLAPSPQRRNPAGHRLLRRRGARGDAGGHPTDGAVPAHRPAGRHLPRPPPRRLERRPPRAGPTANAARSATAETSCWPPACRRVYRHRPRRPPRDPELARRRKTPRHPPPRRRTLRRNPAPTSWTCSRLHRIDADAIVRGSAHEADRAVGVVRSTVG